MKSHCVLFIALLGMFPMASAAEEKSAYDPDDFVISYWCGPPARFVTPDRIKEIKEANFTVAFGAGGQGLTPQQNRNLLDCCQQNGMKAIIYDGRMPISIGNTAANRAAIDAIVKDFADHPALLGYYIVDEPGAHAFGGLGEVVAHLKEKDPKHPGYVNLLPTYARNFNVLGTKTYEEYVRSFVEKVKPAMISYDHYHFTNHGDGPEFWENLRTVRKVAVESNTPFWNIVLLTQHGDYRNLNEAELRFEAMQTVAFGGKGLLWFTYWSPKETDSSTNWDHAMINPDGSRDPHYDMVRKVNAELLAIARQLRGAKSVAVYEPPTAPPADAPVRVTSDQLTVGVFRNGDGKHLALLASRNYKSEVNTRISLRDGGLDGVRGGERFDPAAGSWSPMPNTQAIPPGGAVLLRW
jgi:hypothetical protein